MAPSDGRPADNEAGSAKLRAVLFRLFIAALVVGLIYILYMAFGGADPRMQLKTVDQTTEAYSRFVQPYVGTTPLRPDDQAIRIWLEFFDSDSRKFFDKHYEAIAVRRFQFERVQFAEFDTSRKKAEAMLALVNRLPLSGFGRIKETRNLGAGDVEIAVDTRSNTTVKVTLHQSGNIWYMKDFGGLLPTLKNEVGEAP